MNRISKWQGRGKATAFTLIELLTVIAIIALLSGLVLGLSGIATTKSREARIKGEHARLLTAIESYKAELGNYPPDNADTNRWPPTIITNYYQRAGRSPLFYELSGATYNDAKFTTLNKSETVSAATLKSELGVDGIENSSRTKGQVPYRGMTFKKDQYAELNVTEDVEILVVPLRGPWDDLFDAKLPGASGKTKKVNPWFYDTTSTNRHNPESFDLWTEYISGKTTNVFGNWKE